jgi:hypothetical protein
MVTDIMDKYSPVVSPPTVKLYQRPADELDATLKGQLVKGRRHLYSRVYPPRQNIFRLLKNSLKNYTDHGNFETDPERFIIR